MDRQALRNEWKERIAEYQSSDMTIKDWCQEQNLTYSQFYYWLRKFSVVESPINPTTQWLLIDLSEQVDQSESSIFIRVGEVAIEVKPHFNPELLLQVVRTLTER